MNYDKIILELLSRVQTLKTYEHRTGCFEHAWHSSKHIEVVVSLKRKHNP